MSVTVAQARRLVDLKDEKVAAQQKADTAEKKYRDAEAQFWLDMEDSSRPSDTLDLGEGYGVVQFQRRETITGRVLNDEAAEEALRALGLADAILGPQKVRQKVLSEHVRTWLESGEPLPEGVDFNAKRYVTVSKKG